MQNNLFFFQSSSLGGKSIGLIDLLATQITEVSKNNLFSKTQVIVPNQAMAVWVKDQIAIKHGICANVDCVVLAGTIIDNIYIDNNPDAVIFDFSEAKFIIYEYLLNAKLEGAEELTAYLYSKDGVVNKLRAFQLAIQLQSIFHEYLYLRTTEMINLKQSKFKDWQKQIWLHLLAKIGTRKTFLDVYSYFANLELNKEDLIFPDNLFIFGLTSIYPSQLQILTKIADKTNVYWYYQPCSHEYYGDLLTAKARSKIEQKLLRKPDLSLDDLYLTNGNPLLANLGQQSREFIELLRANDVQVYDFNLTHDDEINSESSLLSVLQYDIRSLKQRIREEYRIDKGVECYADPLHLNLVDNKYDLPNQQQSLKINVCHNRMREVQVMFNEIIYAIENNHGLQCGDILITAPDIDDYAPYIQAVLDNEYATSGSGIKFKLPYFITGNRRHNNYKILETLQLILSTPYQLTISYLLELLQQSEIQLALSISHDDIDLLKEWLAANHTHFGYSAHDYEQYGYHNYSVHSFKALLTNLVLGGCIDERTFVENNQLPQFMADGEVFTPYDNLDNTQLALANKLIAFIDILAELRDLFYVDKDNYSSATLGIFCDCLDRLKNFLTTDDDELLICDKFIGELRGNNQELIIELPVLHELFKEHMGLIKNRLTLSGKITCASLQYARNLPYQYIYVLGMNFGEFPAAYQANQLSILADEWYLADRNYNIEDKQAFLDVILAAKQQLVISYIGRKETDNTAIKPSPVVSLLIATLGHSFSNFWREGENLLQQEYNYENIIYQQSLHPFYNNQQLNYAYLWQKVGAISASEAQNLRWDFAQLSPLKLSNEQMQKFLQLNFKQLLATFNYTNVNLYRVLGISDYNNEIELDDYEPMELTNRDLAKEIYKYFDKFGAQFDESELKEYLHNKGVIGYQAMGDMQFTHYFILYQKYIQLRGTEQTRLQFKAELKNSLGEIFVIEFDDYVYIEGDAIIICDDFARIKSVELAKKLDELPYGLKIRGLITYALLFANQQQIAKLGINQVIIRQMNAALEHRDFKLFVDDVDTLAVRILRYYIRSLTNPVLVHKNAIAEYAKAMNDCFKNGVLKNTPFQCLEKAAAKYSADWNNYELDNIKADPIFGAIADNYFEYIQKINGVNDIAQIGNMLAGVRG